MRGIIDNYFEIINCKHDWQSVDNPFGNLYQCKKCKSYLVNGVLEI